MSAKRRKKKKKNGLARIFWFVLFLVMGLSVGYRILDGGRLFRTAGRKFQVEVLNGTGEKNLAGKTTRKLRRMGVDVLIEGNADSFDYKESILIDRSGNSKLANKLARRIGCKRILQQIQGNPRVDITIILGEDHDILELGD